MRIPHINWVSDALAVGKQILSDQLDHPYFSASSWFAVNLLYEKNLLGSSIFSVSAKSDTLGKRIRGAETGRPYDPSRCLNLLQGAERWSKKR